MFPQKLGSGSSAHSSALDLDGVSRQQVLASRDRDGPGAQRDGRFEGRPLPNADIRRSKCRVGSGGLQTQPFPKVLSKIRGSELTGTCRACGSCSRVWRGPWHTQRGHRDSAAQGPAEGQHMGWASPPRLQGQLEMFSSQKLGHLKGACQKDGEGLFTGQGGMTSN